GGVGQLALHAQRPPRRLEHVQQPLVHGLRADIRGAGGDPFAEIGDGGLNVGSLPVHDDTLAHLLLMWRGPRARPLRIACVTACPLGEPKSWASPRCRISTSTTSATCTTQKSR